MQKSEVVSGAKAGTGPGEERFLDNQRFKGIIDHMLEDAMAITNSQTRNSTLVSMLEIEGTAENRHSRLPSLYASLCTGANPTICGQLCLG